MDRNRCAGMFGIGVLLLMLVASCVYDDRSDCPAGHSRVRICFSYLSLSYDGYDGIDPGEAWRVDLFVFDEEGLFVSRLSEEDITLSPAYYLEIVLPDGDYRLVSWFNLYEHYRTVPEEFVAGVTTFSEALLTLSSVGEEGVIDFHPHTLLYGWQEIVAVGSVADAGEQLRQEEDYQLVVVPLRQDTYRLHFTLRGLDRIGSTYDLTVRDDNGSYYFDNSFAPFRELLYTSSVRHDGSDELETVLTLLRLERDREPVFSLTLRGENDPLLYEANLMDLILEIERTYGRRVDFSVTYRFDIVLGFTENADGSLEAEISINGWDLIEEGGSIG